MDEVSMLFREVLSAEGCRIVQFTNSEEVVRLGIAARRLHVAIALERDNEMQAKYNRIGSYHQTMRMNWKFKALAMVAYSQEQSRWDVDPAFAEQEMAKLWETLCFEARRRQRYLIELQAGMDDVPSTLWRSWG